ncbi:MAG: crossover junction endodeoxyribonuclease RuvC [Patescibacteria group bacterium]
MPAGKTNSIVLGIDPGIADTGYGLISQRQNQLTLLAYGSIKTKKGLELAKRLESLERELTKLIKVYRPTLLAVEQLFFCKNVKTALMVGQARGVILLVGEKNHLLIKEFTPLQVKQGITGYGQADKRQIQLMVKAILGLKEVPRPDDAADALAIAICGLNHQNFTSQLGS